MSDELETNTRIFTLRVWQEERAAGNRKAKWRGHISNVLTGSEQYIEGLDLGQIIRFILQDLQHTNMNIGWSWRLLLRLEQRKRKSSHHSINHGEEIA